MQALEFEHTEKSIDDYKGFLVKEMYIITYIINDMKLIFKYLGLLRVRIASSCFLSIWND